MKADEELYAAKHAGRNRVVCADQVLATLAQAGAARGYAVPGNEPALRARGR